jgi:hypothetical protein
VREWRLLGSVRGVRSNAHPYREQNRSTSDDRTRVADRATSRPLRIFLKADIAAYLRLGAGMAAPRNSMRSLMLC